MTNQSAATSQHSQASASMRVLVSGAGGLIGRELSKALRASGATVTALTRERNVPGTIHWNPEADELSPASVSGFDAVIHLAGEPVGTRRWTQEKKRRILTSRVNGTQMLARALASSTQPPAVFLCASGINFYPSSGSNVLDESAPAGHGFLSEVCVQWEQAASLLSSTSRVVALRLGVVLTVKGGTLAQMLPVFRWGLGGYVGRGDTYLSWITLNDTVRAIMHVLHSQRVSGPVNLVAPEPVTGRAFAEALGRTLGRPARLHIPASFLRLVLGEFADETILSSVRAIPDKLRNDGFTFEDDEIQIALSKCLRDSE